MAGNHRCRCCGPAGPTGGCYTTPGPSATVAIAASYRLVQRTTCNHGFPFAGVHEGEIIDINVAGEISILQGPAGSLVIATASSSNPHGLVVTATRSVATGSCDNGFVMGPPQTLAPWSVRAEYQCSCSLEFFRHAVIVDIPFAAFSVTRRTHPTQPGQVQTTLGARGGVLPPSSVTGTHALGSSPSVSAEFNYSETGNYVSAPGQISTYEAVSLNGAIGASWGGMRETLASFTGCQPGQQPGSPADAPLVSPLGPSITDPAALARSLRRPCGC